MRCINVLFYSKPQCVVNATVVISDMIRINKPKAFAFGDVLTFYIKIVMVFCRVRIKYKYLNNVRNAQKFRSGCVMNMAGIVHQQYYCYYCRSLIVVPAIKIIIFN